MLNESIMLFLISGTYLVSSVLLMLVTRLSTSSSNFNPGLVTSFVCSLLCQIQFASCCSMNARPNVNREMPLGIPAMSSPLLCFAFLSHFFFFSLRLTTSWTCLSAHSFLVIAPISFMFILFYTLIIIFFSIFSG